MPGCCGGSNCSCRITAEPTSRISVSGSGTANDPIVLDLEAVRASSHNQTFDTISGGAGVASDPWTVETNFAPTAKLDHLPDVNVPTPTNGQVLSWNSSTSQWVAAAPTVAPTGAVSHDTTLSGDGSPATPLGVTPVTARLFGAFPTGVGLNDQGMLSVVQHFQNATDRTAALPLPSLNQLSMLDTNPGAVEYWNGSAWARLMGWAQWSITGQLLSLSGAYAGSPVTMMTKQLSTTTDPFGVFDVLTAADLAGRSGVLTTFIQEMGAQPWKAMIYPNTDRISAVAYHLTDGTVLAGAPVTAVVQGLLY